MYVAYHEMQLLIWYSANGQDFKFFVAEFKINSFDFDTTFASILWPTFCASTVIEKLVCSSMTEFMSL